MIFSLSSSIFHFPLALAVTSLPAEVGINHYLLLSALLFAIGFFGVLLRRNTLVVYMCLELMLVASTIAAVAFSRYNGTMDGNILVFFIITVAAAEVIEVTALVRLENVVEVH